MRLSSYYLGFVVLCLVYCNAGARGQGPLAQSASAKMTAAPPAAAGVFLNNKSFDIPFTVERTGSQPVEVQLFVSRDQGKSWKFFARKPASESGFPFEAHEDGDFWFSTRTIDARGISYPTGPMSPQLRVVVDTSNPKVNTDTQTDVNGQIILSYTVADASPDESFRLEYMTDAVRRWMPIAIQGRPGRRPEDGALVGQIAWRPETQWRHVYVRMIVQDKAGNQTVINEQVQRPRIATMPSNIVGNNPPLPPGMNAQMVSTPTGFPGTAAPYPNSTGQPVAGTGPYSPAASSAQHSPVPYVPPGYAAPGYRGTQPRIAAAPNSGIGFSGPIQSPSGQSAPQPPQQRQPMSAQSIPPQPPVAPGEALRPLTGIGPVGAPTTASSAVPPAAHSQQPASANAQSINDTPRVTRSKQFSLDYEVDSIGNGGTKAVELWGTRDRGVTWKRWNADPDKQSPFDIEVSRDGLVGFRIVVVASNGLTTPRPAPGEPADIYILVDTVAPRARLLGATYGRDAQSGSLIIDYGCSDENFGARPISLAFSDKPDGEWTTIATGLTNTGRYVWEADPNLPREIFLRVEATDKAGNIGVHSLDVPIKVEGLSPQGHIRGFQPIEGQPQAQQASALPGARFK